MTDSAVAQASIRTFCTFRTTGRLYGIDVKHVREVSTQSAVTPVPQAPAIIRGLSNLRSRIFLVLDLRAALGLATADCTPDSRLVVLHAGVAENLGLLVDCGGEIVRVPEDQIEETALAVTETKEPPVNARSSPVVG